jgi:hypothetical protein
VTGSRPPRRRRERGWMLAGQILLAVAAAFSLPLGARDGGGVSSILPPLRSTLPGTETITSNRSDRPHAKDAIERMAAARRVIRRRLPLGRPAPGPLLPRRRPSGDDVPGPPRAGSRQSRAPPLVR